MSGGLRTALRACLIFVIVLSRACALRDQWPEDPCLSLAAPPKSQTGPDSGDQTASNDATDTELKMALLSGHRGVKLVLDGSFQGFLIQASSKDASGSLVLGQFTPSSDGGARTHSCQGKNDAVILHKDYSTKTRTAVVWRPPREWSGTVVFRTAIVRRNGEQPQHIVSIPVNVEKAKTYIWSRPALRNSAVARAPAGAQRSMPDAVPGSTDQSDNVDAAEKALDDVDAGTDEEAGGGNSAYKECGATAGCFGFPSGCIATANCLMLVSYKLEDDGYHFELTSDKSDKDEFWIAAGISETNLMDLTSVVECLKLADGSTEIRESWNAEGKANEVLDKTTEGITFAEHSITDGVLKCSWVRKAVTTVKGKTFDLANNKYFVLLATGPVVATNVKSYHTEKGPSAEPLKLGEKRLAKAASPRDPLILVHGNLMILGWLYLVGLAIIIARHFKPAWEGTLLLGDKVWFFLHRGLMVTAMTFVIVSVSVIFYTNGGWVYSGNPHPILGVTTVVLGLFQPIMAFFRCHPEEPNRFIFNWMHWANGNTAHVCAVTTICFASGLAKSYLAKSNWFLPTVAMFVVFYVFVHVSLQVHRLLMSGGVPVAAPAAPPLGDAIPPKPDPGAPVPPAPAAPPAAMSPPPAAAPAKPQDAAAHPPAQAAMSPPPASGQAPDAAPLPPELVAAAIQDEKKSGVPAAAMPPEGGESFRIAVLCLYAVVSLVIAGILCAIVCTSPPRE